MSSLKLVGLCGSLRAASTNRLLMLEAARRFGEAEFTEANLRFPLFDQDIQDGPGVPDEVQVLADQIRAADAVLVVTPEYNKGISGVLKNGLDWLSRTPNNAWRDKPVAILSASSGRSGGERAQNMTRLCLSPFRPRLLTGPELMIAATGSQWDEDGNLTNERSAKVLDELMSELKRAALSAAKETSDPQ